MPPLAVLPVTLPAVESLRAEFATRLTSTWTSPPQPAPPPRSADLFMILFVSLFLFVTAAVLRLVPWVTPIPPHPRWSPREVLPFQENSEGDALRRYARSTFAPYGAAAAAGAGAGSYEALLEIEERIGNASKGLTKEQIDILPIYECDTEAIKDESCRRGAKCAVCRDFYQVGDTICILPCADEFHKDCIAPWLTQQSNCPLCRCRFA